MRWQLPPRREASLQLRVVNQQLDPARFHIQHDPVARLNNRQRAAGSRFRRNVQYDRAECGAAHPRIGNAYHVLHSLPRKLHRDGQVARLRHARRALRPGVAQHQNVVGIHIQIRKIDPRIISSTESNTTARPVWRIKSGDAADCLITALRGARFPWSTAIAPSFFSGACETADHILARRLLGRCNRVANACRRRCWARRDREMLEFAHQRRQAAGVMKMLHVMRAGRLQVEQHRNLASQPVECLKVDCHARAAGHRNQVNQPIGRSADRLQHDHRVAHGSVRDQFARRRRPPIAISAARLPLASAMRRTVGMGGRRGCAHGQRQAHRFHHAGHGACRAHHSAEADGRRQAAADQFHFASSFLPARYSAHSRRQSVHAPSTSPL